MVRRGVAIAARRHDDFARERQGERAYWFLGPATYVKHEGELPMAITWKLAVPLPGDLYASFRAAVA